MRLFATQPASLVACSFAAKASAAASTAFFRELPAPSGHAAHAAFHRCAVGNDRRFLPSTAPLIAGRIFSSVEGLTGAAPGYQEQDATGAAKLAGCIGLFQTDKRSPSLNRGVGILAALGAQHDDASFIERALALIGPFDPAWRADYLSNIAVHLMALGARRGDRALIERALGIAEQISDPIQKILALKGIASHLSHLKEKGLAGASFERAVAIARGLSQLDQRAMVLATLFAHFPFFAMAEAREVAWDLATVRLEEAAGDGYGHRALASFALTAWEHARSRRDALLERRAISLAAELLQGRLTTMELVAIIPAVAELAARAKETPLMRETLAAAARVDDAYLRDHVLSRVAKEMASLAAVLGERETMEEARSLMGRLADRYTRAFAHAYVAPAMLSLGMQQKDEGLAREGWSLIPSIRYAEMKSTAIVEVARRAFLSSSADDACEVFAHLIAFAEDQTATMEQDQAWAGMATWMLRFAIRERDGAVFLSGLGLIDRIFHPHIAAQAFANMSELLISSELHADDPFVWRMRVAVDGMAESMKQGTRDISKACMLAATSPEAFSQDAMAAVMRSKLYAHAPQELVDALCGPRAFSLFVMASPYLKRITQEDFTSFQGVMGEPALALVMCLFRLTQDGEGAVPEKELLALLSSLTPEQLQLLARKLFEYPELARLFSSRCGKLQSIQFSDGGVSPNTFARLASIFLESASMETDSPALPAALDMRTLSLEELIRTSGIEGLCFERALGRTLLFRGDEGRCLAVKLQKEGEDEAKLLHEDAMLRFVEGCDHRSSFPTSVGVFRVSGSLSPFDASLTLPIAHAPVALAYATRDAGYFRYLNDPSLSEEEFEAASIAGLGHLFELARSNILHEALIDLYHDRAGARDDGGRYLWMVSLINHLQDRLGTGRLDRWMASMDYPNLRLSGLADLGDTVTLKAYADPTRAGSAHLSSLGRFGADAPKYYLANALGEAMHAWTLLKGQRCLGLGALDWSDEGKVTALADAMREMFVHAFCTYTQEEVGKIRAFLEALINWRRVALQMSSFMTDAYVADLTRGAVPLALYGADVEVTIPELLAGTRGWTEHGWSRDGETPDLGPVNGPYPLQELVRALYLTTAFMIALKR